MESVLRRNSSLKPCPTVLTIVINWNGKDALLECLDSIKELNYPKDKHKILVVDNASKDGSQEAISRIHPEALLLENEKNVGYARAVNQGVEYGLSSKADYIWILNNDVVVQEDSLTRLVEIGQQDEKIGVVAPVIYSYDNPQEIDNVGYKIDFWTGRLTKLKYEKDVFKDPGATTDDIASILGCSNLIKTSVFRKIGLFKRIYEIYFEETDFNVRARQNGIRVVVVKEAKVWHKDASTMDRFIFRRAYLLLRNLFLFELFNARLKHLFVFIPYYFLIHVPYFFIRGSMYGIRVKLKELARKNRMPR